MGSGWYNFAWMLARAVYTPLYGRKAIGVENLPETGGFVLCANHISGCDPLYIASLVPRKRRVFFIGKEELFKNKLFGKLLDALGVIPIARGKADLAAMRKAFGIVRKGDGLMIFPQGTRSRDNARTPFLTGASMIALRCGAPVVPAYIDGPYKLFHPVRVAFGKPIDFSDLGARIDATTMEAATKRIETAVWSLQEFFSKKLT